MALIQTAVADLAEVLLACVCAELDRVAAEVPGMPGCPCRACVVPGAVAWDDCSGPCDGDGTGGQLTVSYGQMYVSTEAKFPLQDIVVQQKRGGCLPAPSTALEMVVTLLRCAPGPQDGGCPPTCEEQAEAARILHMDAISVYNAISCCLAHDGTRRGRRFMMGTQRALGPQGGCVGIEQRVTVALPSCMPCPQDDESV